MKNKINAISSLLLGVATACGVFAGFAPWVLAVMAVATGSSVHGRQHGGRRKNDRAYLSLKEVGERIGTSNPAARGIICRNRTH